MELLISFLRWKLRGAGYFVCCCMIFLISFLLYGLPAGAVLYPCILCAAAGLLFLAVDYLQVREKHLRLRQLCAMDPEQLGLLPRAGSLEEEDYQALVRSLLDRHRELKEEETRRFSDMVEYYTLWVHQIKTPIASMALLLQSQDSALSRKLSAELLRIEQYVGMVLTYLRLGSESTDYVIESFPIDPLIRQCLRRLAGEFIERRIALDFHESGRQVLSDRKWLGFVIEQLLTNALKYTPEGGRISIGMDTEGFLRVRDSGIGIAPADLPRIFEKGYTGLNGRKNSGSSGIGLYLCRRICRSLGHSISACSAPGQGTEMVIDLSGEEGS